MSQGVGQSSVLPRDWSPQRVLERLLLIRSIDQRCVDLFSSGELKGTVHHASIGQEASALGVALHRRQGDLLYSTHRGVAHCLAWGVDLVPFTAELLGKRGGYANGLGGHMHIFDPDRGIAGTNGIVGAGAPMAVGSAYALRQRGIEGAAVVAFFGDGALNTGAVAEAMNLAAVWSAPVLFVCERNGFAEMTHTGPMTAGSAVSRAAALEISTESAAGDDVVTVAEAAGRLLDVVRGGRPALLETTPFRKEGHWIGDPEHYRDPDEKGSFSEHDPIARYLARGEVDSAEAERIAARVDAQVEAVYAEVLAMDKPDADELFEHILRA
jgi:TPP-dependent pyruvate/acetoin dehydrogenase alpha subunit